MANINCICASVCGLPARKCKGVKNLGKTIVCPTKSLFISRQCFGTPAARRLFLRSTVNRVKKLNRDGSSSGASSAASAISLLLAKERQRFFPAVFSLVLASPRPFTRSNQQIGERWQGDGTASACKIPPDTLVRVARSRVDAPPLSPTPTTFTATSKASVYRVMMLLLLAVLALR
ncbi:hypothetical protein KQX54_019892 [Cotesia glomerata]|uniref:Uncharacterized protein n=1 Tax=Cotesia glomerata TaxID=32391 RepID=A0AAV7IYC1_COTGL|nr:hypothetical protein KQX54_019892 [Cotesia glomerata]